MIKIKKKKILISVVALIGLLFHQFFFPPYTLLFLENYLKYDSSIENNWIVLTYRDSIFPISFSRFELQSFTDIRPNIHFKSNGELLGSVCNNHFGRYIKDKNTIKIALSSSTYKSCTPSVNAVEKKFRDLFSSKNPGDFKTYQYVIKGQTLQLYDAENKIKISLILKV